MKVELKNVKHMESLSRETNCFTASLYIDGEKAGTVENEGQGGNTSYSITDTLEQAYENYAKSLPSIKTDLEIDGVPFVLKMNGENLIDELFESWLHEKKESQRFARFEKKFKKQFAAKGLKTIRITLEQQRGWLACSSEADALIEVEKFETKNNIVVKTWEIL